MTRQTERKTLFGFTIPEIVAFGVLATMVVTGLNYPKIQAQEQIAIHNDSAIAHEPIAKRLDSLEKRVGDIEFWMTTTHKLEVDRAINEITENMENIVREIHKP